MNSITDIQAYLDVEHEKANRGLIDLVEAQRGERFMPEYASDVEDSQVLGCMIADYFRWAGEDIIATLMYALEDANFHSVNAKLKETFPELTEGVNV